MPCIWRAWENWNGTDTKLDWNNRYNLWSGLLGGTFLMLGYFWDATSSKVQRYPDRKIGGAE